RRINEGRFARVTGKVCDLRFERHCCGASRSKQRTDSQLDMFGKRQTSPASQGRGLAIPTTAHSTPRHYSQLPPTDTGQSTANRSRHDLPTGGHASARWKTDVTRA